MSIKKEPQNLFCTGHVLSVIGVLYITTISPAIDKAISEGLTRKEIGHLINSTIVGVIAGSLKILDKDVYTPKLVPGRNREKALDNINEDLLPTTILVKEVVSNNNESILLDTLTSDTDISTSIPDNTSDNTSDNIGDLFKTSKVLKKKGKDLL